MKSNEFNAHGMRLGVASAWMKLATAGIIAVSSIVCGAVTQDASHERELPQTEQFSESDYNVARQRLESRLTEIYQSCSGTFEELRADHPQEVRQLLLEFKDLLNKRRELPQTDGSATQLEQVAALMPEVEAYAQRVSIELEHLRSSSNSSRRCEIQMFEKLGECLSRLREHPLTKPLIGNVLKNHVYIFKRHHDNIIPSHSN